MKTIIIKAKGGMGNRILCTITGLLYSELTNRVPCIDWSDGVYGKEGENAFHHYFLYDRETIELDHFEPSDANPRIWKNRHKDSVSKLISECYPNKHSSKTIHQKFSIRANNLHYTEQTLYFWHYIDRIKKIKPHLQNTQYSKLDRKQIIGKFLKEHLVLQPYIKQKLYDFQKKHWDNTKVIGVHVRFTDRKSSLKKYFRATDKMLSVYPYAKIFLATDNKEVIDVFTKSYKNVIYTPKWLPKPGIPLHVATNCPNKFDCAVEALVDMYLLGRCDALVYASNSTFSQISSCFYSCNNHNIIDIERTNLKIRFNQIITELIP